MVKYLKEIHDGIEILVEDSTIKGKGKWSCSQTSVGNLWYFSLSERRPPPYKRQIHVDAIIDIADDGTVAGIECISDMPDPPLGGNLAKAYED